MKKDTVSFLLTAAFILSTLTTFHFFQYTWLNEKSSSQLPVTSFHVTTSLQVQNYSMNLEESILPLAPLVNKNKSINCLKLIEGDAEEKDKALKFVAQLNYKSESDQDVRIRTSDCMKYKIEQGYQLTPISKEEENFPIAYSILVHQKIAQLERLLMIIYHPQNLYCIHVDSKADPQVHAAIQGIASCFSNVFIVSKLENVIYASFARLQADINCMKDLVKMRKFFPWKYFVNLVSEDFPLKTNLELVRILKVYNGSNEFEGLTNRTLHGRFNRKFVIKYPLQLKNGSYVCGKGLTCKSAYIEATTVKKSFPNDLIQIVRGSAFGAFSFAFVKFVLTDGRAQRLLEWSRDTYSPDEHYWATLNALSKNPELKTPGGFREDPSKEPFLAKHVLWGGEGKCKGRWQRAVCIFGIEDIDKLINKPHFFANKILHDFQPLVYECMSEWLRNKTIIQARHQLPVDVSFYKEIPHILQRHP